MKTVSNLLLFCLILLIAACGSETYDSKKTHHQETAHSYGSDVKNESVQQIPDDSAKEEDAYNLYRDLWQNPLEVIEQLGDLEGKVVADIGRMPLKL